MNHLIAASRGDGRPMIDALSQRTGHHFELITHPHELTVERLESLQPRYVFFPHWSHLIPPAIFERFECVIFHMTDVPFGRGGSPLQNLISRGIYETKISALRCEANLDAGPVYMKRPLSLHGAAEEIYMRAAAIIEQMITELVMTSPQPVPQEGEPVTFKRRRPHESDIQQLATLDQVFDFIRMLDADGYPKAFLETEHLRLEFTRAWRGPGEVIADVRIIQK